MVSQMNFPHSRLVCQMERKLMMKTSQEMCLSSLNEIHCVSLFRL